MNALAPIGEPFANELHPALWEEHVVLQRGASGTEEWRLAR